MSLIKPLTPAHAQLIAKHSMPTMLRHWSVDIHAIVNANAYSPLTPVSKDLERLAFITIAYSGTKLLDILTEMYHGKDNSPQVRRCCLKLLIKSMSGDVPARADLGYGYHFILMARRLPNCGWQHPTVPTQISRFDHKFVVRNTETGEAFRVNMRRSSTLVTGVYDATTEKMLMSQHHVLKVLSAIEDEITVEHSYAWERLHER